MQNATFEIFVVFPMGLGVTFMLWVLVGFWRESRREHRLQQRAHNPEQSVVVFQPAAQYSIPRYGVLRTPPITR
jgi:hypothetical protein